MILWLKAFLATVLIYAQFFYVGITEGFHRMDDGWCAGYKENVTEGGAQITKMCKIHITTK